MYPGTLPVHDVKQNINQFIYTIENNVFLFSGLIKVEFCKKKLNTNWVFIFEKWVSAIAKDIKKE